MNRALTQISVLREKLESAAFLVSKGGSEREAHGKIVESLVLLSQIETDIESHNLHYAIESPAQSATGQIGVRSEPPLRIEKEDEKKEVEKVIRRLPRWFNNPSQYNSIILNNYLKLFEQGQEVTVQTLKAACGTVRDFDGNYNQMKNFGEKNHGKVFEESDGYVTLWEPVKEYILELYENCSRR